MCDSPVILTKIAKNHLNYQRLALNLCAKELRTHFFLFLNLNPNIQKNIFPLFVYKNFTY